LYTDYSKSNRGYYDAPSPDNSFSTGIGIGIEFIILKRISFNLMGGYAGYHTFEQIGFTAETGLYFKF